MLGQAISVRSLNVTVSALKFFWRTILYEELLGPQYVQLENLIKGLRKTFRLDPKGTHVLTVKESRIFFQHALDCAKSKQERVFALSFPIAMRFITAKVKTSNIEFESRASSEASEVESKSQTSKVKIRR